MSLTYRKTFVLLVVASAQAARGDDWPQWRGPRQDGISRETGLLAKWPEKGPEELCASAGKWFFVGLDCKRQGVYLLWRDRRRICRLH